MVLGTNTTLPLVASLLYCLSCGVRHPSDEDSGTSPAITSSDETDQAPTDGTTFSTATTSSGSGATVFTDTSSTSDGSTTTPVLNPCPEHETVDSCCCFEDVQNGTSDSGTITVCPVKVLCPPILLVCTQGSVHNCASPGLASEMPDVITCALQALKTGSNGRISWVIDDDFTGFSQEHVTLDIVGDGTVFSHGGYYEDTSFEVYPVQHFVSLGPSFFEGCMSSPDWRDRFECVRQSVGGSPDDTCIAGYDYSPGP